MFRLFDQLVLVLCAVGIIYFRPEILMRGGDHILEATFHIEDAIGMLILLIGWIGIFDYFIRYKADRLVALNRKLRAQGAAFPKLYLACGTEDFLIAQNRDFHQYLLSEGIEVTYEEGPGAHEWNFWDTYIKHVLDWLPTNE